MSVRIPWDEQETAILINACESVINGEKSQKDVVSEVSYILRERARHKGIQIDEVFRNENGISMQFSIVKGLMTSKESGLHGASKLFRSMVQLYKCDRKKFDEILKGEGEMDSSIKGLQDAFSKWLSERLSPAQMSEIYITYYDIDKYLQKERILVKPMLETTDLDKIEAVKNLFSTNGKFRFLYRNKLEKYIKAVSYYHTWLSEYLSKIDVQSDSTSLNEQDTVPGLVDEKIEQSDSEIMNAPDGNTDNSDVDNSDIKIVKFGDGASYAFTQVEYFEYFGTRQYDIKSWKKLYTDILRCLVEDYPDEIWSLKGKSIGGGSRIDIGDWNQSLNMNSPRMFETDMYVETNLNATNILDKIKHLMDICGIAENNVVIAYSYKFEEKNTVELQKEDKVFEEAGSHKQYTSIKKQETILNGETDELAKRRKEFYEWLLLKGKEKGFARVSLIDISRMSKMAEDKGITDKSLYFVESPSALRIIAGRLQRCNAFLDLDPRLQKQYGKTLESFIDYQIGQQQKRKIISEEVPKQREWSLKQFLDGKELSYVNLTDRGGCLWVIGGRDIEQEMMECWKYGIPFRYREQGGNATHNQPAWWARLSPKEVAKWNDIDSLDKVEVNTIVSTNQEEVLSDEEKKMAEILKEEYENGFRINSAIDKGRLKVYYSEHFGEEITIPDDMIVSILKKVGTLREDRIFAKQDDEQTDLLNQIYECVMDLLKSRASCVYIDSVYQRYQIELADIAQVYDAEVLGDLLINLSGGALRRKQSFLCLPNRRTDLEKDVLDMFKESPIPLSYEDVRKIMWYVPIEKIKHIMVTTKSIVYVESETYFYAPNLPINQEETRAIKKLIRQKLECNPYITGVELRRMIEENLPGIAINTSEFTDYGLRNCLGYILIEDFEFRGSIISNYGSELGMAEVFAAYCREREQITPDELKEFAAEMNTTIYWDAVRQETVRVSEELLVRDDQIYFDVEAIDETLERFVNKEYVPLKDIGLFMHFPVLSVQWNSYVLESFVHKYSTKFRLLHASFSASGYFGAVVRVDSSIMDYRSLIVDVLANSSRWSGKKDALELLVNEGYQQRRRYEDIEKVIHEAGLLREKINCTKKRG